ncbi:Kelch repeat-containing protein [Hyphococcus sp.]|uniref:Kelch repeat-containing protein n=1 Tax=Hyphococcus sp. TaxID=2038636 RepID=UPI003CCBF545
MKKPEPRAHHQLAYNKSDNRVYMMGGGAMGAKPVRAYSDMWVWEAKAWRKIEQHDFPRSAHRLVYSDTDGGLLSFGGADDGALRADAVLHIWKDGSWKALAENESAAAGEPGACYDPARASLVIFGGAVPGGRLNDRVFEWDGRVFAGVGNEGDGPGGRLGHSFTWDPTTKTCLLYGGRDASGAVRSDTWTWDGDGWTKLDVQGPGSRFIHSAASDEFRKRMIIFGGQAGDESLLSDTWVFDSEGWRRIAEDGPSARMMGRMAAFPDGIILFGGRAANPEGSPLYRDRDDTWILAGENWVRLD